jgi:hypothetical protein
MKMSEHQRIATQLACVGVVVCVVFPLGELAYPVAADVVGASSFTTLEAVVTAALGFGLFEMLFG